MSIRNLTLILLALLSMQLHAWPDPGDSSKPKKVKTKCDLELIAVQPPIFTFRETQSKEYRSELYQVLYLLPAGLYKFSDPLSGGMLQLQVSVNQNNRPLLIANRIEQFGPALVLELYPEFKGQIQKETRYREKVIAEVDTHTGVAEWKTIEFKKAGFEICYGISMYEPTGLGFSCFEFKYRKGKLVEMRVTPSSRQRAFTLKFEEYYFISPK